MPNMPEKSTHPLRTAGTWHLLGVDPNASPFVERLQISIHIDHDYIVHVDGHSSGRDDRATCQIHDLEFALTLPEPDPGEPQKKSRTRKGAPADDSQPIIKPRPLSGSVQLRSNVTLSSRDWRSVPGDIIEQWRSHWFDTRSGDFTARQREERDYYRQCSLCKKSAYAINLYGCERCNASPNNIGGEKANKMNLLSP